MNNRYNENGIFSQRLTNVHAKRARGARRGTAAPQSVEWRLCRWRFVHIRSYPIFEYIYSRGFHSKTRIVQIRRKQNANSITAARKGPRAAIEREARQIPTGSPRRRTRRRPACFNVHAHECRQGKKKSKKIIARVKNKMWSQTFRGALRPQLHDFRPGGALLCIGLSILRFAYFTDTWTGSSALNESAIWQSADMFADACVTAGCRPPCPGKMTCTGQFEGAVGSRTPDAHCATRASV